MRFERTQLPLPEAEFRSKYADYVAAREAHKATVGVPAPFPEFEVFRVLYENGKQLEVVEPEDEPVKDDAERERNVKRLAAIEALLIEQAKRADAPQAVKDYAEEIGKTVR